MHDCIYNVDEQVLLQTCVFIISRKNTQLLYIKLHVYTCICIYLSSATTYSQVQAICTERKSSHLHTILSAIYMYIVQMLLQETHAVVILLMPGSEIKRNTSYQN